ncbi:MAG: TlpA family protein disulfide reductase [Nitrospiraceae bacterium]|nr:MAG: TlpA family protein disulfide reductase [Nitrospiraceae bacterium]
MRRRGTVTLIIIAAVFSVLAAGSAGGFNPFLLNSLSGKDAPDFTVKNLAGKDVSLSSFRGKPILLNFWATWCPYCQREREHLNRITRDYRERGLVVLSVSTDRSVDKVRRYVEKVPADFVVLHDSDGSAAGSYNINGLPSSFLIGPDGTVRRNFIGFVEWTSSSSRKEIDAFLTN